MIFQYDAAIIGGDLRQIYLSDVLEKSGYKVITYGLNNNDLNINLKKSKKAEEAIKSSKTIITPIPFSKDKTHITNLDSNNLGNFQELTVQEFLSYLTSEQYLIGGNIPNAAIETCRTKNIPHLDLMKIDDISLLNAIATAEGAIAEAINKSVVNLHQNTCLVLGYGKCAKVLAAKLSGLGVKVTICARNQQSLVESYTNNFSCLKLNELKNSIHDFNYIFNTIPAVVLNKELLSLLSKETTIIDIASSPGGLDYNAAKELNLNAHLCLGIPGKTAPKASAEILAEAIIPILKGRRD
ncbi:MAG: dpaA [Bacillota bacterium]|nr:dpaA [Bacillota bacterium]